MHLFEILQPRIARNPSKLKLSIPTQKYLYHGTQIYMLALILKEDRLDQGAYWHKPNEPHGVRTTRNVNVAASFAFDQEHPGGILVMDWRKIAQKYKTIPYEDTDADGEKWAAGKGEDEEVVLTREIKPLSAVLNSILMHPKIFKELKEGNYLTKEYLESFQAWTGRPLYVYRRAIEILMNYPNFKVRQFPGINFA